ncbi:BON domain-containing protein [Paracidobacterium acidisoli]|nr:BON domain-containing protein [Paracidobacterium acidisoli]MBT9333151.1 BON domain-containing protein [Paracidobacterium acidisoli]
MDSRHNAVFLSRGLRRGAAALAVGACLWFPAAVTGFAQDANSGAGAQQGTRTDADIQADVTNAITHDASLQNQQVTVTAANGQVTLSGTVQTEQQRQQAETLAAGVDGVSGIQNSITAAGGADQNTAQPQQGSVPPPADENTQPPAPASAGQPPPPPPPDQPNQPARAPYPAQPGYYGNPNPQGYSNAPEQPISGPVTLPVGTLVQVRLDEPLDTAHIKDGAVFQATAANDVYVGNVLAIPRGATLQGSVVDAKNTGSGKLGGNAELALQVTALNLGANHYELATDTWSSKGPNKAGYTAGNTVGGAAIGAIIGGIIGRGAGAAVGAGVGAAAGMAGSAATNGPRLYLPAEALLDFHLATPVTVQPVSWQEARRLASNVPQLHRRPAYYAGPRPYGYPYPYYGGYYSYPR